MGILNVTPDSFSDGARFAAAGPRADFRIDTQRVLAAARTMVEEGAAIIDVGGESTRPGAEPVSLQEELERVIPVVEAISSELDVAISVDTSSPAVMRAAAAAGAVMVNDIRALQRDGALAAVLSTGMGVCLMHMQGEPQTMQQQCHYGDVVQDVLAFLRQRVDLVTRAGVSRDRLLVDPGFGFGKTLEHNYRLLAGLARLDELGLPVLVGISRKSMIGQVVERPVNDRLAGSIAAATLALERGASILRSHDVAATRDAIRVHCALQKNHQNHRGV
jgi:dihydropteroate synthase